MPANGHRRGNGRGNGIAVVRTREDRLIVADVGFKGGMMDEEHRALLYLRHRLEHFEQAYHKTGNPLFAWRAHVYCFATDTPLPDWVRLYVARAIGKLEQLSDAAPPRGLQAAVFDALEIAPRPGPGNLISQDDRDLLLAIDVQWRIDDGEQETYAIDAVTEERRLPRSAVYRAWKAHEASARNWTNRFRDDL
jgi:hypothetical protein